jgi:flagellar motor switch protein FliN/FliY
MSEKNQTSADEASDEAAVAIADQAEAEGGSDVATAGEEAAAGSGDVERAEFSDVVSESAPPAAIDEDSNLNLILEIPVTIAMEIGRTRISIRNLLQLNQGSVVELDRLAGEAMDVMVNGTLVAHGEVVVVNEKFGIRLTDVVSPADRVKKLK